MDSFVEKQLYSFIDYISSGFELNFMVAVDFTGIKLTLLVLFDNCYMMCIL